MSLLPIDYTKLNPGIQKAVQFLREHGFDTRDSGDGQTHEYECDMPIPYVHIVTEAKVDLALEADRLYLLLKEKGIDFEDAVNEEGEMLGPVIEAHYNPHEEIGTISLFNVGDDELFGN